MTREDVVDEDFANETHRAFFKSMDATFVTTHRLPLSPRQGTQKPPAKEPKKTRGERGRNKTRGQK